MCYADDLSHLKSQHKEKNASTAKYMQLLLQLFFEYGSSNQILKQDNICSIISFCDNMHMFYICICVFVVSECPAGQFGSDCQDRCECQNSGQCDRQTGQCVCQPGWTGERCENGKVI